MSRRKWTAEEVLELRRLEAERLPLAEIAARLGRPFGAVAGRRARDGLRRPDRFVPDGVRVRAVKLMRSNPHHTATEVAQRLGLVPNTVMWLRRAAGTPLTRRAAALRRVSLARERAREAVTPAEEKYLRALAAGPLGTGAVARQVGVTKAATWGALARLRGKGRVFAEGRAAGRRAGRNGVTWVSLAWWLGANDGLVWAVAHKVRARNPLVPVEDIASVVRVKLVECARSFRPGKASFNTYAMTAARFEAVGYCLDERRRGFRVTQRDRFDPVAAPALGALAPTLAAPAPCEAPPMDPEFWERAVSALPARTAALVLGWYRDGQSLRELGREHGISGEAVRQVLARALGTIRAGRALAEYEP